MSWPVHSPLAKLLRSRVDGIAASADVLEDGGSKNEIPSTGVTSRVGVVG